MIIYDYINGDNLPGNENVLSDDMMEDHDFITAFKTGGGYAYKIGVCGMPLGNPYAFRETAGAVSCADTDEWNAALRSKYSEKIGTTNKYKFDAVVMHTYYGVEDWGHIPLNSLVSETSCSGEADTWQFDEFDERLERAFDSIIGIGNAHGNYKQFLTKTSDAYPCYQAAYDKMNDIFDFHLTTAEKKELWVTEWNMKDHAESYSPLELEKAAIYSNGFIQAYIGLHWWMKNIKINFDPDFRTNFSPYTITQNFAGGTSIAMLSLSDSVERNYYEKDSCPFQGDCFDTCDITNESDLRRYYVRRTPYFTAYLVSEIYKKNLRYLPANFQAGSNGRNVAPTVFINDEEDTLYIYYSNLTDSYQDFVLDPENLPELFPGHAIADLYAATVTYMQAQQLYSTAGKNSLYDTEHINECYDTYPHPFEIKSETEAGVYPAIRTEANNPQCTDGSELINACLSGPPYSVGFFKVPFVTSPAKVAVDDKQELMIYPNPAYSEIYIKCAAAKEENIFIEIFDLQGVLQFSIHTAGGKKIPVSQLASGCYMVKITDSHKNITYKTLIKSK